MVGVRKRYGEIREHRERMGKEREEGNEKRGISEEDLLKYPPSGSPRH